MPDSVSVKNRGVSPSAPLLPLSQIRTVGRNTNGFGQPKSQVPVEPVWRRWWTFCGIRRRNVGWQQKRRRERAQAGLTASSFESQELSWKFLFYRVSAYSLLAWLGGMMSAYLFAALWAR